MMNYQFMHDDNDFIKSLYLIILFVTSLFSYQKGILLPHRGSFVMVKKISEKKMFKKMLYGDICVYYLILMIFVFVDVCGLDHFWQYLLKPPADVL